MKTFKLLIVAITLFLSADSFAQCDTIASLCAAHLTDGFISDGQSYRSLLLEDQMAEFHATFYGGTTYRIAACSGLTDGNLIIRVLDMDRNLIFNNENYRNAPYWDFEIKSTVNCIIEAQLDATAGGSGCAVLLIGFKQ